MCVTQKTELCHSINLNFFGFAAQVKQPGLEMQTVQSELDLSYKQRYQGVSIPEAYERLILDTYESKFYLVSIKTFILPINWPNYVSLCRIKGDQQHFVRRDELKVLYLSPSPLKTPWTGSICVTSFIELLKNQLLWRKIMHISSGFILITLSFSNILLH